jgi:hypothetical protein
MAEGQFQWRGISSSVGFPNFPMSVWLYTLPLVVWPHPYAATLFTGLLNTVSVLGCYWLVRRYWGATAALSAALLYAVSPWAIIYSRKIWAQDLLPLFVVGWGIGAALTFVEGRRRWIIVHLLCLAVAVQIHLSAVALIPATGVFLFVFRRRVNWRMVAVGALLALVTAVPFLVYLQQQWQTSGQAQLPFSGAAAAASFSLDSLHYTTMLSLGTNVHSLAGPEAFRAFLAQAPPVMPVYWLWGALIIGGVLFLAYQTWRRWQTPAAQVGFILLIWLLMPPLFFLLPITPIFPHYFIIIFPAQYMIAGIFSFVVTDLSVAGRRPVEHLRHNGVPPQRLKVVDDFQLLLGTLVPALLLLTAALQLWMSFNLLGFIARTNTPGGFGTPLAMKLEAAETATMLARETGAAEILIAGEGESPRVHEFPAEFNVLLRDQPHRFVDAHASAVFPDQAAVILLDGRSEQAEAMAAVREQYATAATAQTDISLRPDEGEYLVLLLPGGAVEPGTRFANPILLSNFVHLTGYEWRCEAGVLQWALHWRTADNPDPADYHIFNHLLDANGQLIAQADAAAFSPAQWEAGDTVVSHFTLPVQGSAPGPWLMRVGMYRFPSLEAVPLLDEAANPAGDWLEIPLAGCR